MRYLFWLLKLALFALLLSFAIKNTDMVTVRYYLGYEWRAPLVLVVLAFFCLGAVFGVVAGLTQFTRQRRELAALRRAADSAAGAPAAASAAKPPEAGVNAGPG
jgi:putative membrane protein